MRNLVNRDKYRRETIGSNADQWSEDWSVEIQGDENDPDCVIILPKETEEHE